MAESESNNKDLQLGFSSEQEVNKMYNFWAEVLKMPTIGPMYAFSKDLDAYANDFMNLGKIMCEMKIHNDNYWALVNAAYARATKDTA